MNPPDCMKDIPDAVNAGDGLWRIRARERTWDEVRRIDVRKADGSALAIRGGDMLPVGMARDTRAFFYPAQYVPGVRDRAIVAVSNLGQMADGLRYMDGVSAREACAIAVDAKRFIDANWKDASALLERSSKGDRESDDTWSGLCTDFVTYAMYSVYRGGFCHMCLSCTPSIVDGCIVMPVVRVDRSVLEGLAA
jgi:hypothetical protein